MPRTNTWLIGARCAQVVLGFCTLGASFGLTATGGDYESGFALNLTAGWLSVAITLFAFFGFFGTTSEAGHDEVKLLYLIFVIDCWAIVASIGAGTCLAIAASYSSLYSIGTGSTTVFAAVAAYSCLVPLIPLAVRTLRFYSVSVNYWVKDKDFDTKFALSTIENRLQQLESVYGGDAKTVAPSQHPKEDDDEIQTHPPSRPHSTVETTAHWTTVSGAATLIHPSIAGSEGGVQRKTVPSQSAPSYTSRVG